MKRVIIESPYGAPTPDDVADNVRYARACLLDSLRRGEAPYASHLLYTQCLDDSEPDERARGMEAGFRWGGVADLVAVYTDLGVSAGMQVGIERAKLAGLEVVKRALGGEWALLHVDRAMRRLDAAEAALARFSELADKLDAEQQAGKL